MGGWDEKVALDKVKPVVAEGDREFSSVT